jgi:hypothetical protein
MKGLLCLFFLMLPFTILHAQEAVPDTVATEEEYQYIEDDASADDDADSEYDDDDDETPSVTHELIPPDKLPATQDHANSKMTIRKFDDAEWKKVTGGNTFEEKPDKVEGEEDDDEKNKADAPIKNMPTIPWDSSVLHIIAYVIVIALILGIVYYFTKDLRFSARVKPVAQPAQDLAATVENIEHIEVATALQKALAEGNFKLAIRLYYLDLLKKLNERAYIVWKKDKTNHNYLMELYTKGFYFDDIRKLTLAYELVWYGEHTLQNETYQKLFSEFEAIFQKINTSAAA